MSEKHLDKIISLCKRRGFVFPNSEIYGGLKASYDYGPMGVELKKSISELWWKEMTQLHQNIVGIDSAIMVHPDVWKASGHIDNFHDPLVDNKETKKRYRLDHLLKDQPDDVIHFLTEKLIDNSFSFSPIGSELSIVQLIENNSVIIYIIDQGKGIDKKCQREKFYTNY